MWVWFGSVTFCLWFGLLGVGFGEDKGAEGSREVRTHDVVFVGGGEDVAPDRSIAGCRRGEEVVEGGDV